MKQILKILVLLSCSAFAEDIKQTLPNSRDSVAKKEETDTSPVNNIDNVTLEFLAMLDNLFDKCRKGACNRAFEIHKLREFAKNHPERVADFKIRIMIAIIWARCSSILIDILKNNEQSNIDDRITSCQRIHNIFIREIPDSEKNDSRSLKTSPAEYPIRFFDLTDEEIADLKDVEGK